MKWIRKHIADRSAVFGERPLFGYLRDSSIDPERRLAFVPSLAHFVMSFADLYRFFLVEQTPTDHYQELVNAHLSEDVHHWKWFLADLGTMNLDPTLRFSTALRFIWGDATAKTRTLTYQICKMSGGMTSLQKLVMVQCIGVALGAVSTAGREFEDSSGRKLTYFGTHHVETEREHTLEQPIVLRSLDELVVSEAERARGISVVDEAFGHFDDFIDEIFQLAKTGNAFGKLPKA
jgi:hypothetical protein